MAGTRQVKVVISGDASGVQSAADKAAAAFGKTADSSEKSGHRMSSAIGKVGEFIGGEFGEVLGKVQEGLDQVGEQGGKGLAAKLAAGGAGVLALGGVLTTFGAKRRADENQLKAAIEASGHSYDEYEKAIQKTIKAQENFGHREGDTEAALQALTAATNDPAKAIANMGLVANLAAAKHESLATAAGQVAKVYGGSGKILKQYGIVMESAKADTAAVTKAERAHESAVKALSSARLRLTNLTEVDNAKSQLSVSQQITLRKAHEAVTKAIKEHGANSAQAAAAEQRLADVQARFTSGSKLSTAQQIALKQAQDNVAAATKAVTAATDALSAAQKNSKTQTQVADTALTQLSDKLKGQASAASDTWLGRLNAAQSKLADFAAKMGEKYGPAVTILGGTFTAGASVLNMYRGHQEKVAAKAAELAAAQEASAVRVQAAAAEVTAAEAALGESANLSATEQEAAQARVVAAHEAMAAEVTAADEAAGRASTFALGPVGLAIGGIITAGVLAGGALHLFGNRAHESIKPTQDLTNAILADNGALGVNTRKIVENTLQKDGLFDAGLKLGISQKTLTDATMGNSRAMGQVNAAIRNNIDVGKAGERGNQHFSKAQDAVANAAADLSEKLGAVTSALAVNKRAADNLAAADGRTASAIGVTTDRLNRFQAAAAKRIAAKLEATDHVSPKVAVARANLLALNGATVRTYLQVEESLVGARRRNGVGFNAEGTSFWRGGLTWIAEEGPELIDLPAGTRIHNAGETARIRAQQHASGSGGGSGAVVGGGDVLAEVNLYLDGEKVHKSLLRLKRQKGGVALGIG